MHMKRKWDESQLSEDEPYAPSAIVPDNTSPTTAPNAAAALPMTKDPCNGLPDGVGLTSESPCTSTLGAMAAPSNGVAAQPIQSCAAASGTNDDTSTTVSVSVQLEYSGCVAQLLHMSSQVRMWHASYPSFAPAQDKQRKQLVSHQHRLHAVSQQECANTSMCRWELRSVGRTAVSSRVVGCMRPTPVARTGAAV